MSDPCNVVVVRDPSGRVYRASAMDLDALTCRLLNGWEMLVHNGDGKPMWCTTTLNGLMPVFEFGVADDPTGVSK